MAAASQSASRHKAPRGPEDSPVPAGSSSNASSGSKTKRRNGEVKDVKSAASDDGEGVRADKGNEISSNCSTATGGGSPENTSENLASILEVAGAESNNSKEEEEERFFSKKEVRFNQVVTAVRKSSSFTLGSALKGKASSAMRMSADDLKPILAPSSFASPTKSKTKVKKSFKSASMEDGLNEHLRRKGDGVTGSTEDRFGIDPPQSVQDRRIQDRNSRRRQLTAELRGRVESGMAREKTGQVIGCCSLQPWCIWA
eukprot:TRINITY_DN3302_c0_g1_i1.p1 TRINITY_DN3302_c0_g1~~TRINITY_DN3302_c0_g1_i1.p1  ORF type:complete len:283 (+),score=54.66 TRINITY_DN3302_c0_g1_i1:80-850(+)